MFGETAGYQPPEFTREEELKGNIEILESNLRILERIKNIPQSEHNLLLQKTINADIEYRRKKIKELGGEIEE